MMTDEINTDELHALTLSDTKELAGMYMAMKESGRQHALAMIEVRGSDFTPTHELASILLKATESAELRSHEWTGTAAIALHYWGGDGDRPHT